MMPAFRKILTKVCCRLFSRHYSVAARETEKENLLRKIDYIINSIPEKEIITLFAQECRHLKMLGRGTDFDLHDIVSFIADFDYFFDSVRHNTDWHEEIAFYKNE